MNDKQRILKRALGILEASDRHPMTGICAAIASAGNRLGLSKDAKKLTTLVSKRLGRNSYLQGWLYQGGHLTHSEFDGLYNTYRKDCAPLRAKLKATRIAWLKALIKEHS